MAATALLAWPASAASPEQARPNYLGSVALKLPRTPLDAAWRRVEGSAANLNAASLRTLRAQLSGASDNRKIALVNQWVNRSIRFTEDRVQYGRADHWATPQETIARGRGDCEDVALAKRALLAAAGIASSRMFLTIARDLLRKADHAVLIVETEGGPVMLDNMTDELLDARQGHSYRPIFTFGAQGVWTHGFARAAPAAEALISGQN